MFDDQVVVVTGGAGALGQAVVEHFGSRGARVVAVDYSATLLTEALGEQTASCQHRVCDLTDREACRDLTASLLDQREVLLDLGTARRSVLDTELVDQLPLHERVDGKPVERELGGEQRQS
ncbi:MAG: SDR family NAD(P)-dependent oxidoreductase [Pseudomonadales bacterium]